MLIALALSFDVSLPSADASATCKGAATADGAILIARVDVEARDRVDVTTVNREAS